MKKHLLLFAAATLVGNHTFAQCDPLVILDENFNTFTEFPDNCWETSITAPYFSLTGEGDKAVLFYGFSSADEHYLITPELLAIPTAKRLSYMAQRSGTPGDVSVQVGTLASNTDYTSFVPHGAALLINNTSAEIEYNSITIPAIAGHKYIALKIKAGADHQAMTIDDVKLEDVAPPASLATIPAEFIAVYPNPVEDVLNISMPLYHVTEISVFDVVGRKVASTQPDSGVTIVNLENLSSGVYLLHITAKEGKSISKFVKK